MAPGLGRSETSRAIREKGLCAAIGYISTLTPSATGQTRHRRRVSPLARPKLHLELLLHAIRRLETATPGTASCLSGDVQPENEARIDLG